MKRKIDWYDFFFCMGVLVPFFGLLSMNVIEGIIGGITGSSIIIFIERLKELEASK